MSANLDSDSDFQDAAPKPRPRRGLRIGDLLAIVAIVALLIALLLPATRSSGYAARHAARRSQCVNNMKQISLALWNYEREYKALPPAYTVDAHGRPLHSWRTLILPYLEQESLYKSIDLSKPWNDPVNAKALKTPVPIFRCPESYGPENATTYLAISSPDSCFMPGKPRRLDEITDDHGSTLMLIDAGEENAVPWMAPMDADEALVLRLGPKTRLHHEGGMNVGLVDGSVRFVKATTSAEVRCAIMSISGGEHVSNDEF